jgi:hypothetical protein
MGLLKWLFFLIIIILIAIVVLPIPILSAITHAISTAFSILFNAIGSKLNAVASYNKTSNSIPANSIAVLPPTSIIQNLTPSHKSKNIILNVS